MKEISNLEKMNKKLKDLILTFNTIFLLTLFTIYGGFGIKSGGEILMGILLTTLLISIPISYIFTLFYNIIKSFWEDIGNEEKTIKGYKISFGVILLVITIFYSFLFTIRFV